MFLVTVEAKLSWSPKIVKAKRENIFEQCQYERVILDSSVVAAVTFNEVPNHLQLTVKGKAANERP